MRRFNAIGWTAIVVVLAAAVVGVTFVVRAATAGPTLDEAAEACGGFVDLDGESLEFSAFDMGALVDVMDDEGRQAMRDLGIGTFGDVTCLLGMLDAPSGVESRMENTRALDGTQESEWGDYSASWTYHPDDGLNLIVTVAR